MRLKVTDGEGHLGTRLATRVRARRHHPDELRGLFFDRCRFYQMGQGGRHSGRPGSRLRRRLAGGLCANHYRSRSDPVAKSSGHPVWIKRRVEPGDLSNSHRSFMGRSSQPRNYTPWPDIPRKLHRANGHPARGTNGCRISASTSRPAAGPSCRASFLSLATGDMKLFLRWKSFGTASAPSFYLGVAHD